MTTNIEFESVNIGGQLVTDDVAEVKLTEEKGFGFLLIIGKEEEKPQGVVSGVDFIAQEVHHVVQVDDRHWSVKVVGERQVEGRWSVNFQYGDRPDSDPARWGVDKWGERTWGSAREEEE